MENGKIGIYEYKDGAADVQIKFGDIYFEFGADSVEDAKMLLAALQNAEVQINPPDDFWKK